MAKRRARRRQGGNRPLALLVGALLAFLGIAARLVVLQLVDSGSLERAAARQRLHQIELPAERGRIFDRNGLDLALSVDARSVYAQPRAVADPAGTARRLAPLLRQPAARLRAALASRRQWLYLARRIPVAAGDAIAKLKLPGVGVLADTLRQYPSGPLAAQVLGFVGTDGHGLAGVEQQYDDLLRGHPGQLELEQDLAGRPLPDGQRSLEPATPGTDVVLTIDQQLQYLAEQALGQAVQRYHAKGGSVVVLVPGSGEVLAMANMPTFDPNRFQHASADARRNRAVEDVYEPGSTNKTITAAAALEAGVVTPDTRLTVPPVLPLCANKSFHDSHQHGTETLTFAQVVAQSSNIGTIEVARALGKARLARAELAFGYGRATGIGLPGETRGIVTPLPAWRCTDLGVNAIGQGVAVSVLQMATVYATVANGGVLVSPTLLRGTVDAAGRFVPAPRAAGRRVVSGRTARLLSGILEGVVRKGGTAPAAALDQWTVAGKTGTAGIPDPHGRGYLPGAYVASFIGFAPAEHPAVVVAVVVDRPTPQFYGGVVAAPVFHDIAAAALARLGVLPTIRPGGALPGGPPALDGDAPGVPAATRGSPPRPTRRHRRFPGGPVPGVPRTPPTPTTRP